MTTASVQFIEIARERYAEIVRLADEAAERGEYIENLTARHEAGEITDEEYKELLDGVL